MYLSGGGGGGTDSVRSLRRLPTSVLLNTLITPVLVMFFLLSKGVTVLLSLIASSKIYSFNYNLGPQLK